MKKIILPIILGFIIIPSLSFASIDKNLSYGSRGSQVTELQEFLIDKGFLQGTATGNFYSLTLKAVKAFQTANNLPSTGYVGNLTRTEINNELSVETASSTTQQISETSTTTINQASVVVQSQQKNIVSNSSTLTSGMIDFSSFQKIRDYQYSANPSAYLNQNVAFVSSVYNFIPGSTNYISLLNPMNNNSQIMVEIDDNTTYTTLVNKIHMGDTFRIYGIGKGIKYFINNRGVSISVPVIKLLGADDCTGYSSETNMTSDGSPYGFTCDGGSMDRVLP